MPLKSSSSGFSIAGAMVGAGLLGALSVGFIQFSDHQKKTQVNLETKAEILNTYTAIKQALLDRDACLRTFGPQTVMADNLAISAIKNSGGDVLFSVGNTYGNRRVKILSITLKEVRISSQTGTAKLAVAFEKTSPLIKGAKHVSRKTPIQFSVDDSNRLIQCFSALGNAVTTAVEEARREVCQDLGGTYNSNRNPKCRNIQAVHVSVEEARRKVCQDLGGTYDPSGTPKCMAISNSTHQHPYAPENHTHPAPRFCPPSTIAGCVLNMGSPGAQDGRCDNACSSRQGACYNREGNCRYECTNGSWRRISSNCRCVRVMCPDDGFH